MSHLLSINSSTRGEESFSNKLLAEFENQFFAFHGKIPVLRRYSGDIPHLDFLAQKAGRTPLSKHDDSLRSAFSLADELTEELISARALVIATPMFNWGPPSSLKAWIDRIINIRTFYQNSAHLSDLPVSVIISSGGLYSEGENMKHDLLRPLLDECFTRIGVQDLTFINCDPAGPMEYGRIEASSPDSAYSKALRQIPDAVQRIR
jgi:FMN-dependent NADH-azoreductase